MFDPNASLSQAEHMAANARDGHLVVDGERYKLTFSRISWLYTVTDSHGEVVARFNTKNLQKARKWLREYLAN